jgi:hypothetical protein
MCRTSRHRCDCVEFPALIAVEAPLTISGRPYSRRVIYRECRMSLLRDLEAFYQEHRRCGELESGLSRRTPPVRRRGPASRASVSGGLLRPVRGLGFTVTSVTSCAALEPPHCVGGRLSGIVRVPKEGRRSANGRRRQPSAPASLRKRAIYKGVVSPWESRLPRAGCSRGAIGDCARS